MDSNMGKTWIPKGGTIVLTKLLQIAFVRESYPFLRAF